MPLPLSQQSRQLDHLQGPFGSASHLLKLPRRPILFPLPPNHSMWISHSSGRVKGGARMFFLEIVEQREANAHLFYKGGDVVKKKLILESKRTPMQSFCDGGKSPLHEIILTEESKRRIMHLFFCPCIIPYTFEY